MILEQNVTTIVMVTNLEERSKGNFTIIVASILVTP